MPKNDMGTFTKLYSMEKRRQERIKIESQKEQNEMITNITPAPNRVCQICKRTHMIDGVFVTKMEDSNGDEALICFKCAIDAVEIEEDKEND